MKSLNIISYIMNLRERDRLIAVLLLGIVVLWTQDVAQKNAMVRMEDKYRADLVQRVDACDAQKSKILNDDILSIRNARKLVDSLALANLLIISTNNKNIQIVNNPKK